MWDFYPIVMRDSTLVKLAPLLSLKQIAIRAATASFNDPVDSGARFTRRPNCGVQSTLFGRRGRLRRIGGVFHTAEKCFNLMYSRSVGYDDAIPRKKICPYPGTDWACDGWSGKRIVCRRPCGV